MFCKYCGREIKEGEICTCRQQSSKTPYPKPDIRPVMPEQENTQRQGINQNQEILKIRERLRIADSRLSLRKPVNRTPVNKTSTAPQNQRTGKKMGKDWQSRLFCLVFCF